MPDNQASTDNNTGAERYNARFPTSVADPTPLTTQQILREIFNLRELFEAKDAVAKTRFDAMDKAILLLQAFADRTPTTKDVQHETATLREVIFEKIDAIKSQFVQLDAQTEKASRDVKSAVDAAFAAAKEAVAEQNKSNAASITKSEASFTKQIDEQSKRMDSIAQNATEKTDTVKATADEKIDDIRQRMTAMEARTAGITQHRTESNLATTQQSSQIGVIIAAAVGVIGLMVAVGSLFVTLNRPPAISTASDVTLLGRIAEENRRMIERLEQQIKRGGPP